MTTSTAEKARHLATATAREFLSAGQLDIDSLWGAGHAKACPELVAAYLAVCATVYADKNRSGA